ncbi:MAG: hypothetical protein SCK28_02785 [Bacillota bacterium]|nr:hypothetical protein [Bacillota bacterium]
MVRVYPAEEMKRRTEEELKSKVCVEDRANTILGIIADQVALASKRGKFETRIMVMEERQAEEIYKKIIDFLVERGYEIDIKADIMLISWR